MLHRRWFYEQPSSLHILFFFVVHYLSVAKYIIVKALELYKNMLAIMTKDGFDTA